LTPPVPRTAARCCKMWKPILVLFPIVNAVDFLSLHHAASVNANFINKPECAQLNLTDLSIRGKNLGPITNLLCNTWPGDLFGGFPVESTERAAELFKPIFDEGGIFDQLSNRYKQPNATYCLRQQVERVKIPTTRSSDKACPATVDQDLLDEIGPDDTDDKLLTGNWACENGTTLDNCACTRRDQGGIGADQVFIQRRPKECRMVHRGECFGKCPIGYRPTFWTGWFRPVCTNICWETDHPFSCGVGCAISRAACGQIIFGQVLSVVSTASKVAGLFTPGAKYVDVAAQIVKIAEFALQVISKVVAIAQTLFDTFASREEVGLTLVTSIFYLLQEQVQGYKEDLAELSDEFRALVTDTHSFFLQLVDAQYGWKNVNLNWISGVLTRGNSSVLTAADSLLANFDYGPCQISEKAAVFTIEDSGDDRIVGPWFQKGLVNRKKKYVLTNHAGFTDAEKKSRIESNRRNLWSIWVKDTSFGRGWWFGWIGLGWRRLYENRINTDVVPTLGWSKREGALPLPQIAIIEDGGESDQ